MTQKASKSSHYLLYFLMIHCKDICPPFVLFVVKKAVKELIVPLSVKNKFTFLGLNMR